MNSFIGYKYKTDRRVKRYFVVHRKCNINFTSSARHNHARSRPGKVNHTSISPGFDQPFSA